MGNWVCSVFTLFTNPWIPCKLVKEKKKSNTISGLLVIFFKVTQRNDKSQLKNRLWKTKAIRKTSSGF